MDDIAKQPPLDGTSKMHVKQFAEQVANIASEVCCDGGTRAASHKIPSSVEVWCENDEDAEFEVLSVEPEIMMGCRCWTGIRIRVKRTNQPPDSRNAQLENELASLRSESEALRRDKERLEDEMHARVEGVAARFRDELTTLRRQNSQYLNALTNLAAIDTARKLVPSNDLRSTLGIEGTNTDE